MKCIILTIGSNTDGNLLWMLNLFFLDKRPLFLTNEPEIMGNYVKVEGRKFSGACEIRSTKYEVGSRKIE